MTPVSTLQASAALADMLDLPYEEVKFDLRVHLERADWQLSQDLDKYLDFIHEARL